MKKITATILGVLILGACASDPDKMSATYVSPLKYSKYDCDQIIMEMDHVSRRTSNLYRHLDKKSSNDDVAMGVGLILFWPALFLLEGGDGPEATEYANLKGDYEALRSNVVQKKCSQDNLPPSPEEIIANAKREKEEERKKNKKEF